MEGGRERDGGGGGVRGSVMVKSPEGWNGKERARGGDVREIEEGDGNGGASWGGGSGSEKIRTSGVRRSGPSGCG